MLIDREKMNKNKENVKHLKKYDFDHIVYDIGGREWKGRVKIHKVRGINSPIKYSACLLSSYLSSALVKDEREVLLELTNLTFFCQHNAKWRLSCFPCIATLTYKLIRFPL